MDPIIVQVTPPRSPWHLPHLPGMGPRGTRLLTIAAAVVISISMVLFAVVSILANTASFQKSHSIHNIDLPSPTTGTSLSQQASPGGGIALGTGGTSGTNSPVVTLSAAPASVSVGGKSSLKWSVTNHPTSCTASEDWSGSRPASGSETTQPLTKVQTYIFTLTCKTKTGTGFSTVSVGATSSGGSGNAATRPAVVLAATPSSVFTNQTSVLAWTVTNNPTSCTASGDWSGPQSTSDSSWTVGPLTSAKTYSFTLTCQNSGGSGFATATVQATDPPPDTPVTALFSDPAGVPVAPGGTVTLSWKVTNAASICSASGDWSGNKNPAGGSETVGPLTTIKTYKFNITCSNNAGSTFDSAAIQVLPQPPAVSLTVSPTSIYTGGSATISWSATNNPTSCTASGSWSGSKTAKGNQSTGMLNTAKTYLYSLSCKNSGGTGYQNNVALTVSLPPPPVVSLTASPITITAGNSATLSWNATNNPTSCTASGDWSGSKVASSSWGTGTLNTIKTYTYNLSCSNAGGSNSASASVNVTSGGTKAVAPVVTIAVNPTSIGTGSSATISWSATNNPTSCTASGSWSGTKSGSGSQSTGTMNSAGTYTYTLACSNSAGSSTKSTTLTVIAVPVVSVTLSPASINTGNSSTISWSASGNPSGCTAGGSWSGSKAASGSQSTGAMNSTGTFIFSLSCTNTGGSGSGSGTLTVSNAAPVYCGGLTPCHGSAYMSGHASVGNCYAWNTGSGSNYPWIINITTFRPNHKGGQKTGSLEEITSVCNHDIHSILTGAASIPGYTDSGGSKTHAHNSSTDNNTSSSQLSSYRVGYYDAADPN